MLLVISILNWTSLMSDHAFNVIDINDSLFEDFVLMCLKGVLNE